MHYVLEPNLAPTQCLLRVVLCCFVAPAENGSFGKADIAQLGLIPAIIGRFGETVSG